MESLKIMKIANFHVFKAALQMPLSEEFNENRILIKYIKCVY